MRNDLPISPKKKFKYSITFQSFDEESLEIGETDIKGYEVEETTDTIGEILYEANTTYGIYMPVSFGYWESTEPEENRDFFEKGIRKFYALHITNEDGTDISQEENDFITFLLSDGRYEINKFRDYAVGGIVLGTVALGVGALIAYFYFKDKKPKKVSVGKGKINNRAKSVTHTINGKERKFPIKDAWKREHSLENKSEKYEVPQAQRFENGGFLRTKNTNKKTKNMKQTIMQFADGGSVGYSKEDYFLVVKNWVYFTFNYPMGFVKDAFNSKHLEEKFSSSYTRYGSVGVLMSFWANLDNNNRRILALWIKNNYFNSASEKNELQSISDDNYAKIITHWNLFCFNFPYGFIQNVYGENTSHFEMKWVRAYESAGSTGAVNKFFTEMSSNNQELLTDWVYDNYKERTYADGGELLTHQSFFIVDKNGVPLGYKDGYILEFNTDNLLRNQEDWEGETSDFDVVSEKLLLDNNYDFNDVNGTIYYDVTKGENIVFGEELQEPYRSFYLKQINKNSFAGGGRVTTNDGIIESFLTTEKQLKVGNLSAHFNEYDNQMLLRNYGTLIATRKGNDVSITNTKYSKTTTVITNKVRNMALNKRMNVKHVDKFADGGGVDDYFTMKDGSKMSKVEWYKKMEDKLGFEKFAERILKDSQFGQKINRPSNELTHNRLNKKAVIGKKSVSISSYTPNYNRYLDSQTFDNLKELDDYLNKNQILADGGEAGSFSYDYYEVYDESTGKSLMIYAIDQEDAESIAEELDFESFEDGDEYNPNDDDYAGGGSLNDYIDEQVDEFDADENKMRQQYRGYVRDIEYQGFLAIDTSLTPNERLSDYEFDGEEFDRDNLLEVAKKYPQAEYITFHARLMGDSDFGIEDELSPIDDLAMEFDMAKLNQYAKGGSVSKGYNVFNYTDNIYATDEIFKTKKLANDFIKEFRNRFSKQGYYRDNQMNKIDIEDIDLLAIPSDFNPFGKYADGGEAGGDNPNWKSLGHTFKTEKEAHDFVENMPKEEFDKLGDLTLVFNGKEFILAEITKKKYTKSGKKNTIKDWYIKNYPTDELGEKLNEITFEELWNEDYKKYNIYQVIGVSDSVIRERLFEHLAEIKGVDYDVVYRKLFSSDGFYAKGGGVEISHYKVGDEIFIDYMDAVTYCDRNNLSYDEIIKTKQYAKKGGSMYRNGGRVGQNVRGIAYYITSDSAGDDYRYLFGSFLSKEEFDKFYGDDAILDFYFNVNVEYDWQLEKAIYQQMLDEEVREEGIHIIGYKISRSDNDDIESNLPYDDDEEYAEGGEAEDKTDEYWERQENLEMFLNLNDEDIYWKWVNGELTDLMAVELIKEIHGVDFDATKKYAEGGEAGNWSVTDISNAKYLGVIEFEDNEGEFHNFEIMETDDRLVFGGMTNSGFIESGYIEKDGFSTDETLQSLLEDLEVYYNDGSEYTSQIVFNERMAKGGSVKSKNKTKKTKPKMVRTQFEEENFEYAEGGEIQDWMEEALEFLIEETGFDDLEITMVSDNGNEFYATDEDAEYRVFKTEDDAEDVAFEQVREDMEESLESFNQDFLLQYIDGRDFFEEALNEMNLSYAEDIKSEDDERYANRLIAEMVENGIMDEDDALSGNAEELADLYIEDFANLMTEEQLNEGNDGFDYFVSNFGLEYTMKLVIDNNLIDIDEASKDAVISDGIGHFLSSDDGETLYLSNDYVAYRVN